MVHFHCESAIAFTWIKELAGNVGFRDGQPRSRSGPGPVQSVQDQQAWTDRTGPIA